jgi:hypothetical protein
MKVIYTDPDGREGTFHPHLGWLESGKEFEMFNDDEAKIYIKSGLLKKARPTKKETEVKNNGNSIDR